MVSRGGLFGLVAGAAAVPVVKALPPMSEPFKIVYGRTRYWPHQTQMIDRMYRYGSGPAWPREDRILNMDFGKAEARIIAWARGEGTMPEEPKTTRMIVDDPLARQPDYPASDTLEINIRRDTLEQRLTNKYRRRALQEARWYEANYAVDDAGRIWGGRKRDIFKVHHINKEDQRLYLRAVHLARMFLKGKPYAKVEPLCHSRPDWETIENIVLDNCTDDERNVKQKFAAWKADADNTFFPYKDNPFPYGRFADMQLKQPELKNLKDAAIKAEPGV